MHPLIGITMTTRTGFIEYYVEAIEKAGGVPAILPILESTSLLQPMLAQLQGIIFTGGTDINPYYYNEDPKYGLGEVKPHRDEHEFLLLDLCLQNYTFPIMGICRGMQLINVYYGGSMYQCLEKDRPEGIQHALFEKYPLSYPSHRVYLEKDTWLYRTLEKETFFVNSLHHQGIKALGDSLQVSARTSDELIEAIENKNGRFVAGFQWHPEMMVNNTSEAQSIFSNFINRCKHPNI